MTNGPVAGDNDLSDRAYWDGVYEGQPVQRPEPGRLRAWLRRLRRRKFHSILRGFVEPLPARDAIILELGCAPGLMLEYVSEAAPDARLMGIDFSRAGVDVVRRRLASAGIPAEIVEGDFRSASIPEPAALIVSFGLIEHFDDPTPILKDHMRFGTSGSWVGVTVPNLSPPIVERTLRHYAPTTLDAHNLAIMSPEAIRAALETAGLENVRTGASGGPHLPAHVEPGRSSGRLFQRVANAWNLGVEVVPIDPFWQRTLWGMGQIP